MKLHDLRQHYLKGGLTEQDLPEDPIQLLERWLAEAIEAGQPEPNAISLATLGLDGHPDVRVVLIKDIKTRSITFFTNYGSVKGRQLEAHPFAAGSIWWDHLERQVRIRGPVQRLSREESAEYFMSRPRESRLGAWVSMQSETVAGRDALEQAYKEAEMRFQGAEVPLPDYWGGYELMIDEIEFWQGRPGRLHDRIRYAVQEVAGGGFDGSGEGGGFESSGQGGESSGAGGGRRWTYRRLSP